MDMFINGGWHPSFSKKRMNVYDPTLTKPFNSVPLGNWKDAKFAIETSHSGFLVWSNFSIKKRVKILKSCLFGIKENLEYLSLTLKKELGRPLEGCRKEIVSSYDLFDVYIKEGLKIINAIPNINLESDEIYVTKIPVGVTLAITPFNYPINLLMFKLGAALIAGCSVIAKPSEETPLSTLMLAEIFYKKGLPKGVFNVVTGEKNLVTALLKSEIPRKVAFTGSTSIGKKIAVAAMNTVKRVTLELGGQCPAIICKDADLDKAAISITNHSFKNSGQFCYRVNRIFVEKDIYPIFIKIIKEKVKKLSFDTVYHVGEMGPLVNKKIFTNCIKHIKDALKKGGTIEIGGERQLSIGLKGGYYLQPTLISNTKKNMLLLKEETFGPVIAICKIQNLEEGLAYANDSRYGLAGFIFCSNFAKGIRLCEKLEVGQVWLNNIEKSSNHAPFGGIKESGIGREKGKYGIEEYLEYKTMYLKYEQN